MSLLRRLIVTLLLLGAAAVLSAKTLTIGFAQTGAESAWRTANTNSMKSEAEKRGIRLQFADGQGRQENQIRAVRSFIAQGVDAIVLAPIVETGWEPVLKEIKAKGIPVVMEDRRADVDESLYASFIGSDFLVEGKRVGDWLIKKTGGTATIAVLEGTPGSAAASSLASPGA